MLKKCGGSQTFTFPYTTQGRMREHSTTSFPHGRDKRHHSECPHAPPKPGQTLRLTPQPSSRGDGAKLRHCCNTAQRLLATPCAILYFTHWSQLLHFVMTYIKRANGFAIYHQNQLPTGKWALPDSRRLHKRIIPAPWCNAASVIRPVNLRSVTTAVSLSPRSAL